MIRITRRRFLATGAAAIAAISISPKTLLAQTATDVDANELAANAAKYAEKNVSIRGQVIHVCPVNGLKLKLKTANGSIIKIVGDGNNDAGFSRSLNKKMVVVSGIASEERVSRSTITKHADAKTLLCHIDYTPCIDKGWVDRMNASGNGAEYSAEMTQNLNDTMSQEGRDYVSVAVVAAGNVAEM